MNLKALIVGVLLSFSPAIVMAGSEDDHGHSHSNAPVDQATAMERATEAVSVLVETKKLEEIWTSITASSVEKKEFGGHPEWVVVFVNDKPADTEKRKLYVFLTLGGDYIAANFTGN